MVTVILVVITMIILIGVVVVLLIEVVFILSEPVTMVLRVVAVVQFLLVCVSSGVFFAFPSYLLISRGDRSCYFEVS